MKFGDFGTGGRTYRYQNVRRYTVDQNGNVVSSFKGSGILFAVLFGLLQGILMYKEYDLYKIVGACDEAMETVVPLKSDKPVDTWDSALVSMSTDSVVPNEKLADLDFEVTFPGSVSYHRHTEYCQWAESRHTRTKVVGRRERTGSDGKKHVEDITETEVYFTYHKGWHSTRINSLYFDNAGSYHNPSRDPFPTVDGRVSGVQVGGFTAGAPMIDWGLRFERDVILPRGHGQIGTMSQEAHSAGFVSPSDGRWLYSFYEKGTMESILGFGANLFEGVLNLGGRGTCEAGDIRLRFAASVLPSTLSVMAEQRGSALAPWRAQTTGAELFIASEGRKDPGAMVEEFIGEKDDAMFWWRLVIGLLLAPILYLCSGPAFNSLASLSQKPIIGALAAIPHPLCWVFPTLALSSSLLCAQWVVLWGADTAVYLAFPALLVGSSLVLAGAGGAHGGPVPKMGAQGEVPKKSM